MRVLIAVTHLLGVGHLARAALLGRGLVAAGHEVCLASGGRPVPNLDVSGLGLVQLPPVHCRDADFRVLWGEDGQVLDDALRGARREALLGAFHRTRPDVVVTETYPFGRRSLRAEFEALVAAAWDRPDRPALLASVRDILNPPSRPEKAAWAERVVAERYDGVLVHGDPSAVPLERSWPVGEALRPRLLYTGYVADRPALPGGPRGREIVVSGGGGTAGLPLFRAAVAASRLGGGEGPPWRVLVGHGVPEAEFAALAAGAHERLVVERARPDFPALLARAAVSVSQSGYNTVLDLSAAGTPAVLVPFEEGSEQEQRLRAEGLAASGRAVLLPAADLSPEALVRAVETARELPQGAGASVNTEGVARSVALVEAAGARAQQTAQAWVALGSALDERAASGRPATLWWRDDDAAEPTMALDTLLALHRRTGVPLALAVSPHLATDALARRLEGEDAAILAHGIAHLNHAPPGEKRRELGGRPADEILPELAEGLAALRQLFGARTLPVLVPPWNRIDAGLVPGLAALGYRGLSTFGARSGASRDGLAVANTHCDPILWHGGRGLADEAETLRKLARDLARDEPVGLLTHHLVHDPAVWRFAEQLLERLAAHPGARFADAREVFDLQPPHEEAPR
ncbi:glycosyltransferase [Aureimonas sp. AU4]|uniref:glycosyltransferase n=1 Tax=Aureimonas sp. AU4 TaxID=1638163 RepID=UPI00078186C5|nr:glycosyltransferase [Aureimonas sp. AU4]